MGHSIAIVGAGPGGLASALLMRQAGFDVTVYERDDRPGGRTKVFEKDGYRFDAGPTFLMYLSTFEEVFQAVGRDFHKELELVRLDPMYRLTFGAGGHIDCTSNLEVMIERVRDLAGDKDAEGFQRWWDDNKRKLALAEPCLQGPWTSWRHGISKRAIRVLKVLRPRRSIASDLSRFFEDDRMLMATSFQSKYLGMSPYHCPSLFTILAYIEYAHGVYHPIGGLGMITKRMAEIAEEMGVTFHYNTPIDHIHVEKGRISGLQINGSTIKADATVINADFANAMTTLIDDKERKRWSDKKLEKSRYSCSTFMLYLGIEGTYDLPHHQIYISGDYRGNLDDIENGEQLTWDDSSFYVQNVAASDSTMAPEGHSTIYVLVPVSNTNGKIDWEQSKEKFCDRIIERLDKIGFSDVKERIRSQTIITPDDWQTGGIYRGAVFNLAHNIRQMLYKRPNNRFEDVDGVYLVGGGTHPGSGLPVIVESAKITSKLICEEFKIKPDWKGVDTWFPDYRKPPHLR